MKAGDFPEGLARWCRESSVLDVAVGSGSVEVVKCLLEFHNARPSRETLQMAISRGSLELVRLFVYGGDYDRHIQGAALRPTKRTLDLQPFSGTFRDVIASAASKPTAH